MEWNIPYNSCHLLLVALNGKEMLFESKPCLQSPFWCQNAFWLVFPPSWREGMIDVSKRILLKDALTYGSFYPLGNWANRGSLSRVLVFCWCALLFQAFCVTSNWSGWSWWWLLWSWRMRGKWQIPRRIPLKHSILAPSDARQMIKMSRTRVIVRSTNWGKKMQGRCETQNVISKEGFVK